ncbi:MAG: cupin domain-containing protein [Phycisphaerales bacterium]|nr:cupin domain-containing protein [Phycisphaerales bacterium]
MMHQHTIGDPQELAACYSSGAMSAEENAAFEAHLEAGCVDCRRELRELSRVVEEIASSTGELVPDPRVREALMKCIDAEPAAPNRQIWKNWASTKENAELTVVRRDDKTWEETGVPGVRIRRLFVDRDRNQFTAIVQMDAGSSYPRHVHDTAEECLVLEGDLRVGDDHLFAGDYQRASAGSKHGVQSTDGGCKLLIVSSLTDELY